MNAIGSRCKRDIKTVIDQHARAVRSGFGHSSAYECAEFSGRQLFFADLNELATGLRGGGNGFELMVMWRELLAVGDEVQER